MDVDVRDRTDPGLISASEDKIALPGEIAGLHNWPEDMPEPEPVTVAVMDSGIHPDAVGNHPWFEGASVAGRYDAAGSGTREDEIGHGTGVASLIARMAPAVRLVDVKIFGSRARTGFAVIRRAYEWMIENAGRIDLVNMSWGARRNIMQVNQLHERLVQSGIRDVVAAGNTGSDGGSPASSGLAFSAGAITEEGVPARFSSFNPEVGNPDVATVGIDVKMARAPGTSIGSPVSEDFVKASGTSFSAPLTTAAYATVLAEERSKEQPGQSSDWDERFAEGAEDIEETKRDGAGILKLPAGLFDGPSEGEPPEEKSPGESPPEREPPSKGEPPEKPSGDGSSGDESNQEPTPKPPTMDQADLYVYEATLARVIDGDTVDVLVDLGFHTTRQVCVHVGGVDTAEIYFVEEESEEFKEGQRHKAFTASYLRGEPSGGDASGGEDPNLLVRTTKRGQKYGAWHGDLRRVGSEKTLAEALVGEFPSVETGGDDVDKGGDGESGAEEGSAAENVREPTGPSREEPSEEEPVEENPGGESPDEDDPDGESSGPTSVKAITGVGPARAELLQDAGYESASDVAGASAERLASAIGFSEYQAERIIENAAEV